MASSRNIYLCEILTGAIPSDWRTNKGTESQTDEVSDGDFQEELGGICTETQTGYPQRPRLQSSVSNHVCQNWRGSSGVEQSTNILLA